MGTNVVLVMTHGAGFRLIVSLAPGQNLKLAV